MNQIEGKFKTIIKEVEELKNNLKHTNFIKKELYTDTRYVDCKIKNISIDKQTVEVVYDGISKNETEEMSFDKFSKRCAIKPENFDEV